MKKAVLAVFALAITATLTVVPQVRAQAAVKAPAKYLVGTMSIAAAPHGRQIWVSSSRGYDWIKHTYYPRSNCLNHKWKTISPTQPELCTAPDHDHPLKSIKEAVKIAHPGDVIIVRGGNYKNSWTLNGVKGTASKPVVIQAFPGENVFVKGFIQLRDSTYWRISGLRFLYDPAYNKGDAAVVQVEGGSHWTFSHNEIYKTVGTANLGVQKTDRSIPEYFTISWNFIHGSTPPASKIRTRDGQFHNLYITTTTRSRGGLIEHNLILGAPHGTNIKLAGGKNPADSSVHVVVRYNTLGWAQYGVIIALQCRSNDVYNNVISNPVKTSNPAKHAAVTTYRLNDPSSNHLAGNRVSGYKTLVLYQQGSGTKAHIRGSIGSFFSGGLTGSPTSMSAHPKNAWVRSHAGWEV